MDLIKLYVQTVKQNLEMLLHVLTHIRYEEVTRLIHEKQAPVSRVRPRSWPTGEILLLYIT